MNKIRTVIVEDSRLARNEIKELMKDHPELELVGEAENVEVAFDVITATQPDLLLLDINMPGKTGFDLLEMLDESPLVVFTTAYDEYAIKSFEFNTLDYLLKPVSVKRFAAAIEKVVARQQSIPEPVAVPTQRLQEHSQIFVRDGEQCWMVKLTDIHLFEINGNYTRIYFQKNKPLIYKSLNQVEEKLPPSLFFRTNRQQIINVQYIREVIPWFNGKYKVMLTTGQEVELSRRQSALFKDYWSL